MSYVEPEICISWFLLLVFWRTNQVGISGEETMWRALMLLRTEKSFLIFPCLSMVIFVLQLPFECYLLFYTTEITFQYKKLGVAI